MSSPFPRTTVAGVSLSRMVIGTNWILGYSHTTAAADEMIRTRNCAPGAICEILEAFLESGRGHDHGRNARQAGRAGRPEAHGGQDWKADHPGGYAGDQRR